MTRYELSMRTRVIAIASVEVGHINNAAAWADLTEKLEALGIRVREMDVSSGDSHELVNDDYRPSTVPSDPFASERRYEP